MAKGYLVTIVDRNSFDRVAATRMFTVRELAEEWGIAQRDSLISRLEASGEDLLDIEQGIQELDLDNIEVSEQLTVMR